jgi:hypothetical protein
MPTSSVHPESPSCSPNAFTFNYLSISKYKNNAPGLGLKFQIAQDHCGFATLALPSSFNLSSRTSIFSPLPQLGMERIRFLLILLCLFLALSIPTAVDAAKARILIYSATRDFRHDSIPTAIEALKARQDSINAQFDNTEDQTQFTDDVLSNYDTILFLSTTGEGAQSSYLTMGHVFLTILVKFLIVQAKTHFKNTSTLEAPSLASIRHRIP